MIAIIDYDAGNIKSLEKAFQYIGEDTVVSRDKDVILSADINLWYNNLKTDRKPAA